MKPTYLFYDIESSGLSKSFDQVLQFAAIRTDMALNEIERYSFLVQPSCDVIPAPQATITHHIGVEHAQTKGINEYEAIKKIHALLNTPGTISIGYNTLGFDDEFLRFSFWRHLLTPYTHQYANNCGRMDIYPMTVMYSLYHPEVLQWPKVNGQPSLKLENISALNQLAEGPAHDAIVDVEATVALAKKLYKNPEMWSFLCGYFDKAKETQRLQKLAPAITQQSKKLTTGLMLLGKFGTRSNFQAPVLCLGQHHHYRNQTCWLRLDLPELSTTTKDSVEETTWVIRKKAAEPGFILPLQDKYYGKMDQQRRKTMQDNLHWCQQNPKILQAIIDHHLEFTFANVPEADIAGALYQSGFASSADNRTMQTFHHTTPNKQLDVLAGLENPDLRILGTRIVGRHHHDLLSDAEQNLFSNYVNAIWQSDEHSAMVDYQRKPRLTVDVALTELQELQNSELSTSQKSLLHELSDYYQIHQHSDTSHEPA